MCVARFGGCRVARREGGFGPRWRSGRSPSTPVRYRRCIPLSPTTQPDLHISSHECPRSITALHLKAPKTRGFDRGRSWGDRRRTCASRRADRRSARRLAAPAPLGGASVRRVCVGWGAVGYPSIDLRSGPTRLLRCVAMKTTRLLVLTLVLALSAAIAAGCGSSSGSGGGDDPAALVPAGAPLYLEGVVRPDGQVRTDLEGALKKIMRTDDPGAKIQQLIDDSGKRDDVTFKDDVEPWLGDRVGFAITALHNGQDADYAAVIDSKDDGKAEKLLAKQEGTVKRSYNGTDYRFDAKEKTATALIDHRVVVATEGGLKAIVDGKGKDHLDQANGLTAVRSKVAQDRIGLFYLDVQGLVRAIAQQASSDPQVGALVQSFASAAPRTLGAALQAQPDALRVDAVSIGTPKSSTPAGSGADVLATLPGNAWLGLGVGNLGQTLDRVVQTVAGGGITGVG